MSEPGMIKALAEEIFTQLEPQELVLCVGDELFRQGECVNKLHFIKSGKIKLIRSTVDGTPVIIHVGRQGESIAEASLFSSVYHCSAMADSASKVLCVNKPDYLQYIEKSPVVMMSLLATLAHQVRDARATNELKNIRSARDRILSYIKYQVDDKKELKLLVSLKDMAYEIGLAHETFYRELKKLEDSGIINRNAGKIVLL